MEHGFFHPSWGYWQAIDDVPDSIFKTYPEGTVEVPLKPGENFEYTGSEWVAVPPNPPTEAEVRQERDTLLANSDWTQLPDAQAALSDAKKLAWAVYRQALRDVPQQSGFPANVVWPDKPQ